MRGTLRRLRNFGSLFSHCLVHDGIFLDKAVDEGRVQYAFNNEAALLRLHRVRIVRKPLDDAKEEYHRLLARHAYSHEARIPIPPARLSGKAVREDAPATQTVCTGRRRPHDTRGKVPKLH